MYTAPDTAGPRVRSDQTYQALKTSLLRGDHLFGVRLAEERLAAELGVSRTPVREALSRLHAEGLVERHPHGGYGPSTPDLLTVRELYEVRFALELAAIDRPTTTGLAHDLDDLGGLAEDWRSLEAPEDEAAVDPAFVLLDEDFHVRLAAAAGNAALADQLSRVNERIRIVRMQDFLTVERIEQTIAQHLELLELLLAGDRPASRRSLLAHFGESLDVVEERSAAALARMLTTRRSPR